MGIRYYVDFNIIDMMDLNFMHYMTLLDLEWFIDNNGILNNKMQKTIIFNDEYEVYISLDLGPNHAYTTYSMVHSDEETYHSRESLKIDYIFIMIAWKEFDAFQYYINPTSIYKIEFYSGNYETTIILWNTSQI